MEARGTLAGKFDINVIKKKNNTKLLWFVSVVAGLLEDVPQSSAVHKAMFWIFFWYRAMPWELAKVFVEQRCVERGVAEPWPE